MYQSTFPQSAINGCSTLLSRFRYVKGQHVISFGTHVKKSISYCGHVISTACLNNVLAARWNVRLLALLACGYSLVLVRDCLIEIKMHVPLNERLRDD
jgi:hypothetical protein